MSNSPAGPPLRIFQATRDVRVTVRIFCIPFAGGGASTYYRWADGLPSEVQVCPVQFSGHESRFNEPLLRSMGPMVAEIADAIAPWTDEPYAIFGHSMGALVAFETVRRLRDTRGTEPLCLFVSARRAPHVESDARKVAELPDAEFVAEMQEQYNAIPDVILQDRELMERFIPILKADMAVLEGYTYTRGEPLTCAVSAFGGVLDRHVTRSELDAWRTETTGPFRSRHFSGGHFYFRETREPLLRSMTQDIRALQTEGGWS